MKKLFAVFFVMLLCLCGLALADDDAWMNPPVITAAYEISAGKLYLEWQGSAPVYQVYMDGQSVASAIVSNAIIPISKGTHAISVYPINETKNADTTLELGFNGKVLKQDVGTSITLDLGALGLDPKKLVAGNPSETLSIDYIPDAVFDAQPEIKSAITDFNDHVVLSFTDRYNADEYLVTIKVGRDVSYVKFSKADEDARSLLELGNGTVTLILDPAYLSSQGSWAPELDQDYKFAVQLRKYADNVLNGENITSVIHESKTSGEFSYKPIAAWKTAPVVTYASQTADGQISIEWTHDDNGLGCEYAVMKITRVLGIQTAEEELAVTTGRNCVLNDLMNGDYSIAIVPRLNGDRGSASADANVKIQNDWVVAPKLVCQQEGGTVKLNWTAAEGVETYHITVYKGDNASLLRFVNLDFQEYAQYDVTADAGDMSFTFEYNGTIDQENGERLKFDIYGIRHAANGDEQRTTVTSQMVILRDALE